MHQERFTQNMDTVRAKVVREMRDDFPELAEYLTDDAVAAASVLAPASHAMASLGQVVDRASTAITTYGGVHAQDMAAVEESLKAAMRLVTPAGLAFFAVREMVRRMREATEAAAAEFEEARSKEAASRQPARDVVVHVPNPANPDELRSGHLYGKSSPTVGVNPPEYQPPPKASLTYNQALEEATRHVGFGSEEPPEPGTSVVVDIPTEAGTIEAPAGSGTVTLPNTEEAPGEHGPVPSPPPSEAVAPPSQEPQQLIEPGADPRDRAPLETGVDLQAGEPVPQKPGKRR